MYQMILGLIISLFFSLSAQAIFPQAHIKNFSGKYQDDQGEARADYFKFEKFDFGANPHFQVEKQGNSLFLDTPKSELEINPVPFFMKGLKGVKWSGVNMKGSRYQVLLNLGHIIGQKDRNVIELVKGQVFCQDRAVWKRADYLSSCLKRGGLSFQKLKMISQTGSNTIKNFRFDIKNKRFTYELTAKVKVRGEGVISYSGNKLTLKITKAKLGALNIMKAFFKELQALNGGKIKVSRPYIIISL